VTSSWSSSYGLFQSGNVESTFTYLTSLIYEWEKDPNQEFEILTLKEGHPLQIEFVAINVKTLQKERAEKFVQFLLTQEGQKILINHNYMLPTVTHINLDGDNVKSKAWLSLPILPILKNSSLLKFQNQKVEALNQWKASL